MKGEKRKAETAKAEIRNEFRHLSQRPHPLPLSRPTGEGGVGLSPERSGSEPSAESPCVTRLELTELLRVSVRTVDRMIAAGELPVRRVRGRAVRFLRSDVDHYLNGGGR
jgi:excisionase family DNA binding protein